MSVIETKLKIVPDKPGVYIYYDQSRTIIYIGKAKSLKNRVRSYFRGKTQDPKTQVLVSKIADMEWIITDSEVEALLLENNLIKQHVPRYNIMLKDDKTYPYICISNETFPRVFSTRNIIRDGSQYYGPYTDQSHIKRLLKVIYKIFPVRTCRKKIEDGGDPKDEPCLQYHLGNCKAPCIGKIGKKEYQETIEEIIRFLNGNTRPVIQGLTSKMEKASKSMEYENAARIRDRLQVLKKYTNTQSVVQTDFMSRDVIALAVADHDAIMTIFRLREGVLIGRERFHLKHIEHQGQQGILKDFIRRYYSNTNLFPKEVFIELEDDIQLFEDYLKKISGSTIKIICPERGKKAKLFTLAKKNADMLLKEILLQKMKLSTQPTKMVEALQQALNLSVPPLRIEGFDISHFQGKETVASMVYFENGTAKRSAYRKFIVRSVDKPDDFQSMREVVERRYTRLLKENAILPDLILIDGGKGQLGVAKTVLNDLELNNIPVIGLAKRLEEVFIPGYSHAQNIPKASPAVILLRRIRDEAHRFAITFHRSKRGKSMVKSILDNISGVGEIRRKKLLSTFGSTRELVKHSADDIAKQASISIKLAETILLTLNQDKDEKIGKL
ncbi:MAG: excinuclease ABC subunit UvrC [Candidatus Marinimicrobia bacterium]|nr:excinuclease ABC subunit UvrC [Candidatus Neomarinimicrobiota bacterium]